jgi:trehalose-phosphatase
MKSLEQLARSERLLVAVDFDGTIAPIVPHPDQAKPLPESLQALEALSRLPDTVLAVVSGRDLLDLQARLEGFPDCWFSASHGRVIVGPGEVAPRMGPDPRLEVFRICHLLPGIRRETKDHSVAFHWRGRDQGVPVGWIHDIQAKAERLGLVIQEGRQVIEILTPGSSKVDALRELTRLCKPSAIVYAGDDRTDQAAIVEASESGRGIFLSSGEFAWLPPSDVLVLDSPESLAIWLSRLARERSLAQSYSLPDTANLPSAGDRP